MRPKPEHARGRRPLSQRMLGWRGCALGLFVGVTATAFFVLPEIGVREAQAQFFWGWGERQRQAPAERAPRPRRPVGPPPQQQRGTDWFPLPWRWGQPSRPADVPARPPSHRGAPRDGGGGSPSTATNNKAPPSKQAPSETAKRVLVLGDSMADWLGYGLETTFEESDADRGEWAVTRRPRTGSGLIHNGARDVDWVQTAKETLAAERADIVLMMVGLNDSRQPIREGAPAADNATDQPDARSGARRTPRTLTHEFRSERWVELYTQRVDQIIAALKAKGVPVFWVGLPPINGPRARTDLAFLNDIFKARAEKAGITYIDIWDGFIEEGGAYSSFGPDVLGQRRRLRSPDGMHFTEPGAVKLAHFVDREIKRLLSRNIPVALPAPTDAPLEPAVPGGPAPRPVAGPVVSLTGDAPSGGRLLGSDPRDARAVDPLVQKVLVHGEAPPRQAGRADNFAWPPQHAVADQDVASPPTAAAAEPETTGAAEARPLAREASRPGRATP